MSKIFLSSFAFISLVAAGSFFSFSAFADDAKWNCMKDGEAISVEGKTAEEKKVACEKHSGTWEKQKEKKKEQESGSGSGW